MAENKFIVQRLNNENYHIWKYKMKLLLMKEGVWNVISDLKPDPVTPQWTASDNTATVIIGLSVEDNQLNHIRKAQSAKESWCNLQSHHEKSTLSNKVQLMRQICNLRLDAGGNMENHIQTMTTLFDKLIALGEDQLSENWTIAMILSSLPRSYDTLVTALETRNEADLTLNLVQSKLLEEYKRQQGPSSENSETAMKASTSHSRNKTKCYFCNKYGHMKKDCRKYESWKEKHSAEKVGKVTEGNEFCFSTSFDNSINGWVIDSGASCHISSNVKNFINLDRGLRQKIVIANGEEINAVGIGTCKINFLNSKGERNTATVENVLYVPSIQGNLLSVNKLMEKGFSVVFKEGNCQILKDTKEVASAERVANLHRLTQEETHNALTITCTHNNCQHHWHRIFGHREIGAIKKASTDNLVNELKLIDCGTRIICRVCTEGKMTRLPFPKKSEIKSKAPLDLVVTDVCGPMQTATPSNNRDFLTVIDDYSRYTIIYLLKEKSEVPKKIKEYIEMVKTKFSRKPKIIRSDNGKEYTNKELTNYLKKEGIRVQYTTTYTPQQNGIAERKNRSLVEMTRCLLLDAGLDKRYWGEAVMTATYLQNRLLSSAIRSTPYELWEGQKPDISNLHIFGTKGYVYTPKEKRRKLDKKAELKIFIGYDEHAKGYRFLDADTNKVTISRDVRFLESTALNDIKGQDKYQQNIEEPVENENTSNIEITINSKKEKESVNVNTNEEDTSDTQSTDEHQIISDSFTSACDNISENEESNDVILRRSSRVNKGIPPRKYSLKVTSHITEPKSFEEALHSSERMKWTAAMQEEINSLKENNAWVLEKLPSDRKAVGCRWTYKLKLDSKGNVQRHKARLVAQGFSQKYGVDYDEIFAPVVKQATFRTLLSIAGHQGMIVKHLDVKTAFLNGNLKEIIYMKQPPGFEEGDSDMVCKLQKSLYGLKQSARVWNSTVHSVLIDAGYKQAEADPCLYSKSVNNISCYVLIYVDDLVIASKENKLIQEIEGNLKKNFDVNNLGDISHYIGIEVTRDKKGHFSLNQTAYIEKLLNVYGLEDAKPSYVPIDPGYHKNSAVGSALPDNMGYQQLIGSLLYIGVNTRPDIAAAVSILARKVSNPHSNDWNECKRILKYLKTTAKLQLNLNDSTSSSILHGFADADWAEDRSDRKSRTGFIFFIYGGAVSWTSRKQNCVALSSTEAEFIALSEACKEASWLRKLLNDFDIQMKGSTIIWEDNQSCLKLAQEERMSNRTKHIDTKFYFVKDYINRKIVQCKYIQTSENTADILTKPLSSQKMKILRIKCGLSNLNRCKNEEECCSSWQQ